MEFKTVNWYTAFSDGSRTNRFSMDGDVLRVWDSVAGHYTTLCNLPKTSEGKIRKEYARIVGH